MNELIVLPVEEKSQELFFIEGGTFDPELEKIREAAKDLPFDMSVKKNRDEVASFAYKVARSKTAVDKAGFAISAKYKEIPKKIDASRRKFKEAFEQLQSEVRAPLDEWELAEQARIDSCKAIIARIENYEECEELNSSELEVNIQALTDIVIDESLAEFENEAHQAKQAALAKLNAQLEKQKAFEAQQAELEKLRKEAAEREQKEHEDRIAREAAEKARLEAAQEIANAKAALEQAEKNRLAKEAQDVADKIAAEKQAIIDKQNAEKAVIKAVEDARKAALQRIENARLEQERLQAAREADKNHKAKINRQAVADLVESAGLDEYQAKKVVVSIAKNQVSSIKINY